MRDMRDYVWAYFELHARQRMSLFNFFLVLVAFVLAGLGHSIQEHGRFAPMGVLLGILLVLVSFVFWKLDQRVSLFLKLAEDALADLEPDFSVPSARLVSREREKTKKLRKSTHQLSWAHHLTYGGSFRSVFRVMALVGLVGAVASVLSWAGAIAW